MGLVQRSALASVACVALAACGGGAGDDAATSGGGSGESSGGDSSAGGASGGQDPGSGGVTNSGGAPSSGGLGGEASGGGGSGGDGSGGGGATAPRFQSELGFLPADMSADGRVIVGRSAAPLAIAYFDGEREELEPLVGDVRAIAYATSGDGTVIVGVSGDDPGSGGYVYRPVVWEGGTAVELEVPIGLPNCHPTDVTADGRVIVGACDDAAGLYPSGMLVRWLDGVLDEVPMGAVCAEARVSDLGEPVFSVCGPAGYVDAARWDAESGAMSLGLPENCILEAVAADGLSGAGYCYDTVSGYTGFRWSAAQSMIPIDGDWLLEEGATDGQAFDISEDGVFLVGGVEEAGARVAVRWASGTPERVSDLLAEAGVSASGWVFENATVISGDGMTMAGYGYLDEAWTGWIVRLD